MKGKETLVLDIRVGWEVISILIVVGVVIFAFLSARAQDDNTATVNSIQEDSTETLPETAPEPLVRERGDQVLTINDEWISRSSVNAAPSSAADIVAASVQNVGGRHFYVTAANYATDVALTACASGYHMASLWEILDVSNLSYDYGHPDAHVKADSGNGPPSYWYGWVRTGQPSSGSSTTGTGNCRNWSSGNATDRGVSVRLSRSWESAPGDIGPWDATSFPCNFTGPVWCVRDSVP